MTPLRQIRAQSRLAAILRCCLLSSLFGLCGIVVIPASLRAADFEGPLASWTDGPVRQALLNFVDTVVRVDSQNFVPPSERIAVFDHDGTLWIEQPLYVQAAFSLDRAEEHFERDPKDAIKQTAKAIFRGDRQSKGRIDLDDAMKLFAAMHANQTPEQYHRDVSDWLSKSRHPALKRPYKKCVYQPMIELIAWLQVHDFQVWICTGGEGDFVRSFSEEVYGIPPAQVIGTGVQTRFDLVDGRLQLVRTTDLVTPVSDRGGKPVMIARHIGRRPILAFGNSDGDIEMLQYVRSGEGPRMALVLRHDDDRREYRYDRESRIGKLDRGLDIATSEGWITVSMRRDFRIVFPSDEATK